LKGTSLASVPLIFLKEVIMINKALKVIRQFHNMKQVDLATELQISKSYLSEIEAGKKPTSLELLNKYSDTFDIPVSSLIFFSENLGKEGLSSNKFKNAVASKIIKVMEWFIEKNEQKIKA
jgi:transcriptional regulator with XRE-family HTH domain